MRTVVHTPSVGSIRRARESSSSQEGSVSNFSSRWLCVLMDIRALRIQKRLIDLGYEKELDWLRHDAWESRMFACHKYVRQAKDLTDRSELAFCSAFTLLSNTLHSVVEDARGDHSSYGRLS
jgi:hypothetical protein